VRRMIGVTALLLTASSGCSPAVRDARQGEALYAEGRYRDSYEAFQRALARSADPALHFSVGTALYRLRRYDEAARSFREVTGIEGLKQAGYYNLGNAYLRASEDAPESDALVGQAIAAYEEALRLNPADSAAKWNLEVAVRRRGEDRESGGSSGRGRSADYGRGNMNVPGYEGNPEAAVGAMAGGGYGAGEGESAEELSESEARQLLEAVDREHLSSHQGNPSLSGGSGQKDW
jgi:tetratricopeptide (TPR) repeat protein